MNKFSGKQPDEPVRKRILIDDFGDGLAADRPTSSFGVANSGGPTPEANPPAARKAFRWGLGARAEDRAPEARDAGEPSTAGRVDPGSTNRAGAEPRDTGVIPGLGFTPAAPAAPAAPSAAPRVPAATAPVAPAAPDPDPRDGAETDFGMHAPMQRRSAFYVVRKAVREFLDDNCQFLAAGLTFYSVLAIFPAALALMSILGVVGDREQALNTVLDVLRPLVSPDTLNSVEPTLRGLGQSGAAPVALVAGIVGGLWSASSYVQAFGRAMNDIYEVEEGRPFWKLRPIDMLVTLASVLLIAVALIILVVSGPVAESIGNEIGLGAQTLTVWNYAKWPVLAIVVMIVVGMLYHFTPNVKLPKFRLLSAGAFVAIVAWLVSSLGFAFFVANFANYNKTYGSVAGVVVTLLWLWITNLALLFGGELDSEIERARQLHRGKPAEDRLQLPMRDDRGVIKAEQRREKDLAAGRAVRESRLHSGSPDDVPF